MITIEIHGLNLQAARKTRVRIFKALIEKKFVKGVTVEIYPTETMTIAGEPRPYMRLATNFAECAADLLKTLHEVGDNSMPAMSVGYITLDPY